jgi:Domain of unknown function (DUF4432)
MTIVNLNAVDFARTETELVEADGINVSAFRYASGVAALRIRTQIGEVIFLPFHGQQIWDCQFYGRRLTMRSMFDDPVDSQDYLKNYGAFLLHCGATAMGNPGPGDTHGLHGELPNARYQEATLHVGADADGAYIELSGRYRHTVAFAHNFIAEPSLRIHAGHGRMQLDFKVHNLKRDAMDLMYLAHVNFRPIDNGQLVDTVPDEPKYFRIRDKVPEFFTPTASHTALIEALKQNPALHRTLRTGQVIDPELVMGLHFKSDAKGWAHSMQILPDGSADFISHRPEQLRHGVRWITRTANQDALGLFLPGTAEADGYVAEKIKGNLLSIPASGTFSCALEFGALAAKDAAQLSDVCRALQQQK